MELTEAMRSQNACRYYKSDPVPNAVFYNAIEAARFGPQGGNRQPVRFLIVTDPAKKKQLSEWYNVPWKAYYEAAGSGQDAIEAESGDKKATNITMSNPEKSLADADNFAQHYGEHPAIVLVLADLEDTHPTDTDLGRLSIVGGASVYTIAQNFCLAMRDQGVATTFTTLLCMFEKEIKALFNVPENLSVAAAIVAGYPEKGFPKKLFRRPVEEMAFVDSFDKPLTK